MYTLLILAIPIYIICLFFKIKPYYLHCDYPGKNKIEPVYKEKTEESDTSEFIILTEEFQDFFKNGG